MHIPAYNTPRSAGLPMTRNMPYSSSSVPHRSRNLTGIYLGLEGNTKPPRSKSAIPPLARGRGMSASVRTPTEDRRYKMVEYLRIKEEKRGFTGSAVRKCKSANNTSDQNYQNNQELQSQIDAKRRWGPGKRIDPSNIDDLIRPNPRNFTTVSNSGVTRSEKLAGWNPMMIDHYSLQPMDHVTSEVVEEVQKIASSNDELSGLEECYKRICKGNIETLYSLLPNRKGQQMRRDNVGFTVRSYRNPAKAEILAEFPDPLNPNRPKTVPIQRPLVPSPFFFRHHYSPFSGTANPASSSLSPSAVATTHAGRRGPYTQHGHYSPSANKFDDSDQLIVPRILAVPGAGGISKTLQYGQSPLLNSLQLLNGKEYMSHLPLSTRSAEEIEADVSHRSQPLGHPPSSPEDPQGPPAKEEKEEENNEETKEPVTTGDQELAIALETAAKDKEAVQETEEEVFKEQNKEKEGEEGMASQVMIVGGDVGGSRPRPRLTTSNSGADIMLGLETDDGKSAEVEIDSLESDELKPEEIPKGRVRKTSIVEKISKSKESELIALSIMENAGQRQREFEKLISEHQELVQEISRTPSAENIVQSESSRDP